MKTQEKNYLDCTKLVKSGAVVSVTKERYWEMLECLPPERMASNAFLVGEPTDHDRWGSPRFDVYFENEGRYYNAGICTTADFDAALV